MANSILPPNLYDYMKIYSNFIISHIPNWQEGNSKKQNDNLFTDIEITSVNKDIPFNL